MGSSIEEQQRFLEIARENDDKWDLEHIPDEGPQHRVVITKPFYLSKYETTQAQWEAVMEENKAAFRVNLSHPIEQVSWDDVNEFVRRMNFRNGVPGLKFMLPTEARWEYACRAGTTSTWACGDTEDRLTEVAWIKPNSRQQTHPVGELRPNAFGLYDMNGNVWEWCSDGYDPDYYSHSPTEDPPGSTVGGERVTRGGGYNTGSESIRAASRFSCFDFADYVLADLGVRLAASIVVPE